ncbi:MAG: hypothetical protein JSR19_03630 [Proteobacteria bacterium]|nr:hypothetical protein [Pseudomonadota bacterium]HQR05132.1 hypothetical protein [Rhodocyclaceae bacterium]
MFDLWRRRFGLMAPRVAVRPHIPWYWRAASVILILALSLALAGWMYDLGRSLAGFDSWVNAQAAAAMRTRLEQQSLELDRLRKELGAYEGTLQMERAAKTQLATLVQEREAEIAHLREELAVFESLAKGREKAFPSRGGRP